MKIYWGKLLWKMKRRGSRSRQGRAIGLQSHSSKERKEVNKGALIWFLKLSSSGLLLLVTVAVSFSAWGLLAASGSISFIAWGKWPHSCVQWGVLGACRFSAALLGFNLPTASGQHWPLLCPWRCAAITTINFRIFSYLFILHIYLFIPQLIDIWVISTLGLFMLNAAVNIIVKVFVWTWF